MVLIKKKQTLIIFSFLLGVFLASCGPAIKVPPEDVPVVEKNKCILDETPKWYTNYPDGKDKDGKVVKTYHSGTTERDRQEDAKRLAIYEATKNLGESIGSRLNLRTKEFLAYDGSDLIANDLDEVVKRTIELQEVSGYVVIEQKFATCDTTKFIAWVLLEYDLDNEDKVLVEEINKKPDLAIELRRSQAFQELEEELNKAN